MSDLKFDIDGKDISSEKINSGKKSFDSFYSGYAAKTKPFYQKGWFWAGAGLASVAIALGLFLNTGDSEITSANVKGSEVTATNNIDTSSATNISASAKEAEIKPFVNPPIDGVNVPWEKMLVDASKGGVIQNKRGSKLTFPRYAFVDKDGKEISTGKVEIRYREFMDQIDQVVSGIPMTYDSAGVTYQFLSAGMLEVKGYVGDEEVQIAPEKEIQVELASGIKGTEYNLYELNPKERNWDCLGKDKVVEKNIEPKVKKVPTLTPEQETAKLQKVPQFQKLEAKKVKIQNEIAEIEKTEPKAPLKASETKPGMELEYDKKEFPELDNVANVKFEFADGQIVEKKDADIVWNDIQLEKVNDQYKVTYTETETGYSKSYFVDIAYEGEHYDSAKSKFDTDFAVYSEELNGRKNEERKVMRQIAAVRNNLFQKEAQNQAIAQTYVYRIFNVNNFGTFNCDSPGKLAAFASARTKVKEIQYDGQLSDHESVFYINKSRNTYLSRNLTEKKFLKFRKKGDNFLLMIKGQSFGFIKAKRFKNIVKQNNGVFAFGELKPVENYSNLKKQLDFN